jgi:hypothetical protein
MLTVGSVMLVAGDLVSDGLALLGLVSIGGVVVELALDIMAGKSKGKESFV